MSKQKATHELKTWPEFFQPIWEGKKLFEVRNNDRNYKVGDYLNLQEYKPTGILPHADDGYSGREVLCKVLYIPDPEPFTTLTKISSSLVIMSIKIIMRTVPGLVKPFENE